MNIQTPKVDFLFLSIRTGNENQNVKWWQENECFLASFTPLFWSVTLGDSTKSSTIMFHLTLPSRRHLCKLPLHLPAMLSTFKHISEVPPPLCTPFYLCVSYGLLPSPYSPPMFSISGATVHSPKIYPRLAFLLGWNVWLCLLWTSIKLSSVCNMVLAAGTIIIHGSASF